MTQNQNLSNTKKFPLQRWGFFTLLLIISIFTYSSFYAIQVLTQNCVFEKTFSNALFGDVLIRIDALSAWFIMIINIVIFAGTFYGWEYLEHYTHRTKGLAVHLTLIPIMHISLILVTAIQNLFYFLLAWEVMSLTSFLLVIFERNSEVTLKAGIIYFIQMHISVVSLIFATFYLWEHTHTLDFQSISSMTKHCSKWQNLRLFTLFFVGFGIKAGFVPFHTWLPRAHPAAPSHISGIMSGVIIKMGIFGILRVLLNIENNLMAIGLLILSISLISALYGIMMAIVQHNLKSMLAFSSIENIGLVGIGIGIGCIGLNTHNQAIIFAGFGGALLHVFNHSLFKSLLFFGAGNIYQSTGTLNIEYLGGLVKKLPHTAVLFLIAALAISGLPPFNGFISELLIYIGFFKLLSVLELSKIIIVIFGIIGVSLVGGLAILCFTNAFGISFLGSERKTLKQNIHEAGFKKLIPMYMLATMIIIVGLFPFVILGFVAIPVSQFSPDVVNPLLEYSFILKNLSFVFGLLILIVGVLYFIRAKFVLKPIENQNDTWGCGYVAPTSRLQYTASSFSDIFAKLFQPIVQVKQRKIKITSVFPKEKYEYESHAVDKIESLMFRRVTVSVFSQLSRLRIFQNGQTQQYILYGFIFIIIVLLFELI